MAEQWHYMTKEVTVWRALSSGLGIRVLRKNPAMPTDFNVYGEDGWELVQLIPMPDKPKEALAVFKRRVIAPAEMTVNVAIDSTQVEETISGLEQLVVAVARELAVQNHRRRMHRDR